MVAPGAAQRNPGTTTRGVSMCEGWFGTRGTGDGARIVYHDFATRSAGCIINPWRVVVPGLRCTRWRGFRSTRG
jgi:hypothetical protein